MGVRCLALGPIGGQGRSEGVAYGAEAPNLTSEAPGSFLSF